MFNPAETKNEKDNPGVVSRTFGIVLAILSGLLVILQLSGGNFAPLPWLGVALGFTFIVIGYLQKIAANN